MARRYNSPRRAASAAQTRRDIVEAAISLHGRGITDLPDLAREAGVALPTVRKHFATRERVFEACTAHIAQSAHPVPLADLAAVVDPAEQISATVRELYERFEARLGLTWTAYRLAGESAAFAAVLARNRTLARTAAEMLVSGPASAIPAGQRAAVTAFVGGLLSPLAFRALRLEGGLDLDGAIDQVAAAIGHALGLGARISREHRP
jgi:AcrR family transcriptional regulator